MICEYFRFSKTESSLSDDTKNVLFTLRNKSCSLIKTDIHVLRIMALTDSCGLFLNGGFKFGLDS